MPPTKKLKILFITSEVVPFVKTGGIADVSSALPQQLTELGHQVRIVIPKYGAIDERKFRIHEVVRLKDINTEINGKEIIYSIRSSFLVGQKSRIQLYLLDNEEYFGSRHSLYADPITGIEFSDNDERFILFTKAVFELIKRLGWIPDIIHCNDWQCGLVPAYLKTIHQDDDQLKDIKTLFTIHNISEQGVFSKNSFEKTDLPAQLKKETGVLLSGKLNFMKAGLQFADTINTVSETYAKEICTSEEFGEGLGNVLKKREKDVFGVINGIDVSAWNPEKDTLLPKKF